MTEEVGQPMVSVVIPTYNHAPMLKDALASVIAQTFEDWEAIVVNNYSEDETVEVVNSFKELRIRLVNFHNNGCIAASRNQGIQLAKGHLIAFLDSDDKWYPDKLKQCVESLKPEDGLICHGLRFVRNGEFWKDVMYGPKQKVNYNHLLYTGDTFPPTALMVRKEALAMVGGFNEDSAIITAEDYDLLLKLGRAGVGFSFIKDVLGEYSWHSGNSSNSVLRQMNATFAVVGRFFPSTEEAGFFQRILIRRRRALIYTGFARTFQRNGHMFEAGQLFWKGAVTYPFIIKLYAAMVLYLLSFFKVTKSG